MTKKMYFVEEEDDILYLPLKQQTGQVENKKTENKNIITDRPLSNTKYTLENSTPYIRKEDEIKEGSKTKYNTMVTKASEKFQLPKNNIVANNFSTDINPIDYKSEIERMEKENEGKEKIKVKDPMLKLAKSGINALVETGKGIVDFGEGILDTGLQLGSSKWNPFMHLLYDGDIKEGQEIAKELIQEDASQNFIDNVLGYGKVLSNGKTVQETLDEDSLIKSNNIGGKLFRSTGNMLPSIMIGNSGQGIAGQIGSYTSLGLNSFGGGLEEAYNDGANRGQANLYGIGNAGLEMGTEWITGGIPGTGGKGGLDNLAEKGLKKITNQALKETARAGYKMAGEGVEEMASEYFNPYLKEFIYKGNKDDSILQKIVNAHNNVDWNEVKESGMIGALSGGILEAPVNISNIQGGIARQNQINSNNRQIVNLQSQQNAPISNKQNNIINEQINKLQQQNGILRGNDPKIINFQESAKQYLDDSVQSKNFQKIAEKLISEKGYNIILDNTLNNGTENFVNAQINTVNGEIEIRINPNSPKAGEFLLVHEITHSIETDSMKNLILDYASKHDDFKQALESLKKTYKTEDVSSEVIADISGELFGKQEFINNLSIEQPNIFKRLYNKIVEFANRLTGNAHEALFIRDLKQKWEKAYREDSNQLNTSKFSIQTDENGNKYVNVDTDQDIFDGINPKDYNKIAKMYINDYLRGETKLSNNDNAIIDSKSTNKYTNPGKKQPNFIEKMKLTPELKNILEISQKSSIGLPTKDTSKYSKWEYYNFNFKIGNQNFNGKVNIGIDNKGRKHFYEVNNIKKTSGISDVSPNRPTGFSENNIPQSGNSVKPSTLPKYSMQENINNTQNTNNNYFPLDNNAKRYDDLSKTNYIEYFTKDNGDVRINMMDTNNNVVNQIDLWSNTFANQQLGKQLGDYIYNHSNSDNQVVRIGNDVNTLGEETDYFMNHRPTKTGLTADDITNQNVETPIAKDTYEHPEWYFQMNEKHSQESMKILKEIKGNPNAEVTIYRATPGNKINSGDWVTLSKTYAEYHNNSQFDGKANILEMKVKAKDVQYAGDDINEFGYFPNGDVKNSISNNSKWQEYLDNHYKNDGTKTYFKDIKKSNIGDNTLPKASQNAEIQGEQLSVNNANKKNYQNEMISNNNILKIKAKNIAKELNNKENLNIPNGKELRRWSETSTNSELLKDFVTIEDLDMDKITYTPISNKKTLKNAQNKVSSMTYEEGLNYVNVKMNDSKVDLTDLAVIDQLLVQAKQKGDYKTATDLMMNKTILGTELGQMVQQFSMIGRTTPEGQLQMYQKIINRAKAIGDKSFEGVEITPEMVETVLKTYKSDGSYTQKDLDANMEVFKKQIVEQMKSTTADKINGWRYLSMLGNPKTHIRNIVSNVAMNGTMKVKNAMAKTLESAFIHDKSKRTKTWKSASEDVKNFAKESATELKDVIQGESKYGVKNQLKMEKKVFHNKILEGISNFNSKALSIEDWWFSKNAYINSLQEYLTAKGITTQEQINNNKELIEQAKLYAIEQAEIATFRQYSKVASYISKIENTNSVSKVAVGAMLPFKKTPINVAKTGVKYSPLGLIKTVTYDAVQLKNGNINASQFIDNISQGITGTSLMLLGYALAKAGFVTGDSDDDKEGKYDSQLGNQGYALKLGNKTYSLSWLSPVAMPFLMGANAYEELENKEGWDANIVIDTLAKTIDPVSEMSFISGLTDALSSYKQGSMQMLSDMAQNTASNYTLQFVPTLFSQIASVGDSKVRSTSVDRNSSFKFGNKLMKQAMYKIPGLRNQLPVATDIWGKEKTQSGDIVERAFNSFISPFTTKEITETSLDKELKRVYKETGETSVIPGVPQGYLKYKDIQYDMSSKEYTNLKKMYGSSANKYLSNLVNNTIYKKADDDTKAKMIKTIYSYSKALANKEFFSSRKVNYTSDDLNTITKLKELNMNDKQVAEYVALKSTSSVIKNDKVLTSQEKHQQIADYLIKSTLDDKQLAYLYGNYYSSEKKLDSILSFNIPLKEFIKFNSQEFESDYDDKGIVDNSKKNKVLNYINSLNLSTSQKAILAKMKYSSYKKYDSDILNYINKLNLSKYEKSSLAKKIGFTAYDDYLINYILNQNISKEEQQEKLEELGFTIKNNKIYK